LGGQRSRADQGEAKEKETSHKQKGLPDITPESPSKLLRVALIRDDRRRGG
jgi:hypothetical protein